MRRALPLLLFLLGCEAPAGPASQPRTPGADASPITFERMAKFPEPGWNVPRAVSHSPDGKLVTFLASENDSEVMTLFAYDVATRAITPIVRGTDLVTEDGPRSREEELRRERQRQRSEGITAYHWARRAPSMVIPYAGDIFVRDEGGKIDRLTTTKEPELDPQLCATGERVAFVRGSELGVIETKSKKETMLTAGAPEGITRGQTDFNGQEELDEESGYLWSPTCDRIYFLEVDERKVSAIPVLGWRSGHTDLMMQRYPEVGARNPVLRAGFVEIATKKITWITFADESERYVIRPRFSEDGKTMWLQSLSRDQKRRALVKVDPTTGKTQEIQVDTSPAWVDPAVFSPLANGDYVIDSPKTGHLHLEIRRADGTLARTLTSGDWDVTELVAVDEEKGRALFIGTKESPIERQLYAVPLQGGGITRLSEGRGVHAVQGAEKGRAWVDVHSARNRLPRADIFVDDRKVGELPIAPDPTIASLRLQEPVAVQVKSPGGPMLHGALWKPRADGQKHPAIVNVYGGPGRQLVTDRWSPHLFAQHMAHRGFYVLELDNRGTDGRGPAFAQLTHKMLGKLELEDQIAGVDWLAAHHPVDPKRVGIQGYSYGGMMVTRAMLYTPGKFAAGLAGAPVTDLALYDTGYTERYMETPATNPAGYRDGELWRNADKLQGAFFLVHGNMDENVHYTNSARLIEALVAANKTFDLLVVPGERHGFRNPKTLAYMLERSADFFAAHL